MTQAQLIAKLQSYIFTNALGLITGAKMQEILSDIIMYAFHTDNFANDVRSVVLVDSMADNPNQAPTVDALKNFLVFSYLVDNLTTQDTTKALTAQQGYELKQLIDTLNSDFSTLIVDDVTTGGTDKALSAEQGKNLKTLIDGIQTMLQSDNVNLDTIQEFVDAIENVQSWISTIIIDDLVTGGSTKALSAEQGKILKVLVDTKASTGDLSSVQSYLEGLITDLQNDKINYSDVVDNLTTNTQMPLSANQGLILKGLIDGIQTLLNSDNINLDTVQELVDAIEDVQGWISTILVNDLTTGGTTKALTAQQGVVLKALVDARILISDIVNDLTTGGVLKVLSAEQGLVLKGLVDARILISDIVNDLTTGGALKVLSAEQGVVIKALIDALKHEKQKLWEHSNFLMSTTAEKPFTGAAINGGTTQTNSNNLGKLGVRTLVSGTLSNSGYRFITNQPGVGQAGEAFVGYFKTPGSFSGIVYKIGFHDTTDVNDAIDSAGYLLVTGGVVEFKTALSSTRTTVSSVTLSINTWYKVKIVRLTNSTTELSIYSDTNTLLSSTVISTNIPTAVANWYYAGVIAHKTSAGAATLMDIDYMGVGPELPIALNI